MHLQGLVVHTFMLSVLIIEFLLAVLPLALLLLDLLAHFADALVRDPLIIAAIERFVVNVVLITRLILGEGGLVVCITNKSEEIKERGPFKYDLYL
jgi:hypothetical protein